MRRMLTETEVEKLDSIKPSEIEKLGKITNADIESVQATQSPKDATAGQVLTADGKGKAVYKDASGGTTRILTDTKRYANEKISTKFADRYGTYVKVNSGKHHVLTGKFDSYYTSVGGTNIKYTEAQIIIGDDTGTGDDLYVCFPDDVVSKYNITADTYISFGIKVTYYEE